MSLLLFVIVALANVVFVLLYSRTCSASKPNWLFWLYWLINILVAFVFFGGSVDWKFNGLSYLLVLVDVFIIAYMFIPSTQKEKFDVCELHGVSWTINNLLILCFVAGIIYAVLELTINGFSVKNLFSFSGLTESGYYFTDGRYGGRTVIKTTTTEQICLTINYSGFILAGYCYRLRLSKLVLCFLQFLPMTASMMATTAKTTLISGLILWMTGYLVACNCTNSAVGNVRKIPIKSVSIIVASALVLFYYSFVIRYGVDTSIDIIGRMVMYGLGHVPCYDDWFSRFPINLWGYSHGQQTFMMFYGKAMPPELRQVFVPLFYSTSYSWTNVITLFAYVIMDFGYVGTIIFFALLGVISKILYNSLLEYGSAVAHGAIGFVYYIIFYSFLVSPLRYMSITGAFLLFGIYIFGLQKKLYKPC